MKGKIIMKHDIERLKDYVEMYEKEGGGFEPCKHGHIDCSIYKWGPCIDETLSIIENHETEGEE